MLHKIVKRVSSILLATVMVITVCSFSENKVYAKGDIQEDVPILKESLEKEMGDDFIVGASICLSDLSDEKTMALVTKHFNAITFGNELKPDSNFNYSNDRCPGTEETVLNGEKLIVPVLNFERPEKMLDYVYNWNEQHPESQIKIRGHVLTWHSQTPEWFFHEDYDAAKPYVNPEEMTKRHEWYIKSVLEHFTGTDSKYKDMFYGWDVVNEAVSDGTGTYRNDKENSSWWAVYGSQEYIINAFRFANKYAPASLELYYNDYNECDPKKAKGIVQLLTDVKNAEGTRIDAMGMQGHYHTSKNPSMDDFKAAAKAYAEVVGKVQLTELDYQASSEYDGTKATYNKENAKLAHRYQELYDAIKELRDQNVKVSGLTLWGVIDKNSWLQHASFVGGGANGSKKQTPLLFDDDYQVKPSFWAFADPAKMEEIIDSYQLDSLEDAPVVEKKEKPESTLSIPKGTPVIDGKLDDAWQKAAIVPLEINLGAKASATVRLLWDEENLYAFYDVKDAVLNADSEKEYERDSIEIFMDERNHKTENYRDDDKQYRVDYNNEQSFNGDKALPENLQSAVEVEKDGYQVEIAVKWTSLHPVYGKVIGLELQVNDADKTGARIGTLNWFDKSGQAYMDPSVFGTATLVKELEQSEIETMNARIDNENTVSDSQEGFFYKLWKAVKNIFS